MLVGDLYIHIYIIIYMYIHVFVGACCIQAYSTGLYRYPYVLFEYVIYR